MLGYTVAEAWDLTPREMMTCRDAIRLQRRTKGMWTLWQIAGPNMRHMPTLADIIGEQDMPDPSRLTDEEITRRRAILLAASAALDAKRNNAAAPAD